MRTSVPPPSDRGSHVENSKPRQERKTTLVTKVRWILFQEMRTSVPPPCDRGSYVENSKPIKNLGLGFIRGCCVPPKRTGGGSARFHHSARCASKRRRPNLREAGRTTGNPMLCYAGERLRVAFCVFWGARVASGAQWPTSVAAQVIWQAKQTKFGFSQV